MIEDRDCACERLDIIDMTDHPSIPRHAYVFHMGSLGDGIVHWPLYRAMCRGGWSITLVGQDQRVALAAAEVNASLAMDGVDAGRSVGRICAQSCELRHFRDLWCGECGPESAKPGVELVIAMFDDAKWLAGARAMFPAARVVCHGALGYQPSSPLWREFDVAARGHIAPVRRPDAAIVMHLGAGAEAKRWPVQRFEQLQELLAAEARTNPLLRGGGGAALPVRPIFGEVELERFGQTDRDAFARMCRLADSSPQHGTGGGPPGALSHGAVASLSVLADAIRTCSVFIGCDTGPTHLAAQLGVPTVALYSADQTDNWLPRGPQVRMVRPQRGGVENITAGEVLEAVQTLRGDSIRAQSGSDGSAN